MAYSLAMMEFKSIAEGMEAVDFVSKAADVEILYAKTSCPGKYVLIAAGEVGAVNEALNRCQEFSGTQLIYSFILPAVHGDILNAIKNRYKRASTGAIGIMETYNISSGIKMLDKALKSADVHLLKLCMGFGIGGKCYFIITGDISSVEEGLSEAEKSMDSKLIVSKSVIPSPSRQFLETLL